MLAYSLIFFALLFFFFSNIFTNLFEDLDVFEIVELLFTFIFFAVGLFFFTFMDGATIVSLKVKTKALRKFVLMTLIMLAFAVTTPDLQGRISIIPIPVSFWAVFALVLKVYNPFVNNEHSDTLRVEVVQPKNKKVIAAMPGILEAVKNKAQEYSCILVSTSSEVLMLPRHLYEGQQMNSIIYRMCRSTNSRFVVRLQKKSIFSRKHKILSKLEISEISKNNVLILDDVLVNFKHSSKRSLFLSPSVLFLALGSKQSFIFRDISLEEIQKMLEYSDSKGLFIEVFSVPQGSMLLNLEEPVEALIQATDIIHYDSIGEHALILSKRSEDELLESIKEAASTENLEAIVKEL